VDPYPSWLNAGDTSWQLTAATLVGLMSLPGLAVLYGGLVQRKWAVNTMIMAFSGFCLVLIVWVLWVFKMGFGHAWIGTFLGRPGPVIGSFNEQGQAHIPSVSGAGLMVRVPSIAERSLWHTPVALTRSRISRGPTSVVVTSSRTSSSR